MEGFYAFTRYNRSHALHTHDKPHASPTPKFLFDTCCHIIRCHAHIEIRGGSGGGGADEMQRKKEAKKGRQDI